jgi:hypothetical protein
MPGTTNAIESTAMHDNLPVSFDAIERQLQAYNTHDANAFAASFTEDVVIEDLDGAVLMRGRDEVRSRYAELFAAQPDRQAEIVSRMRVGSYVVDEERITGVGDEGMHALAIYRIDADGLIDRVRFVR